MRGTGGAEETGGRDGRWQSGLGADELQAQFRAEHAQLQAENAQLQAELAALREQVQRRLGLDSSNSGKPPSRDGPAKPSAGPRTRSTS